MWSLSFRSVLSRAHNLRLADLRIILSLFVLTFSILPGHTQSWKQYPYVPEGSVFSFPADEGHHPDEDIEWWYISGHLKGLQSGTNYSFMLVYFAYPYHVYDGLRILNLSNDDSGEFYEDTQLLDFQDMGLGFLNIEAYLYFVERWENWTHRRDVNDNLIPFEYEISATGKNGSLDLNCTSLKPPVYLGDSGRFDIGTESYTNYYSQTMNSITGTINFKDIKEEFEGTAWIDHQYGGFNLITAERYERFSIQLSNNMEINLWSIFTENNVLLDTSTFKHITIVDDSSHHSTSTDFKLERLAYHFMEDSIMCYSQKWHLTSPENQLDLIISTLHNHTEVLSPFRFYEGATNVFGTVNGIPVTGIGFAELLKTYDTPQLIMNYPADESWDGTSPISWHLFNPDDGRPLLYDLVFSTDHFENDRTLLTGLNDTLFYWENPPFEIGDSCWFRVKGYSIDSTLVSYSPISQAFVYSFENTSIVLTELNLQDNVPFRLFPNPTHEVLNIEFNQEPHSYHYQILDMAGKKFSDSNMIISGKRSSVSIDHLTPGTYIIRISIDSEEFSAIFQVYN